MEALEQNAIALRQLEAAGVGSACRYIGRGHRIGLPNCETGTYQGQNPYHEGQALYRDDNGACWGLPPRLMETIG